MATADVLSPPIVTGLSKISLSQPVITPEDYATFSFSIPHERYVGLLACQRDPHLRELETLVTKCEKRTPESDQSLVKRSNGKEKGKTKGKNKTEEHKEQEEIWEIELLDTVLFPEGGGQASDTGTLILLDEEDASPIIVKECIRRNLSAVHMCSGPVKVGTRVLAKVDWDRRHDLCTQHTAQHLLSAVLEHHFACPTLGWALGTFPNLSYVELPRCPTKEELNEVEKLCNNLIIEGRRVRIEMELSNDEGDNRPSTLPVDYIGGVVRTVIIDDLDRNPCCGTHYPSLSPLQAIHVSPYTTPIRGTNTRVYFLAGPRVTSQLSSSLNVLKNASSELSCGMEQVDIRVKALADQIRESTRKEKRLREEVAELVAFKTVQRAKATASDDPDALLVAAIVREEDSTNDIDFLSTVQMRIKEMLGSTRKYMFALAQVGTGSQVNPDGCCLIFAHDDALVNKVADLLKKGETSLKLKGGGRGRWQGKVTEGRLNKDRDEKELLRLLQAAI